MDYTVHIHACAGGKGHGVGHAGGGTVFVPGAVPGDVVRVEFDGFPGRRKWMVLPAVELLEPSSDRVPPFCPLAPDDPVRMHLACGGCPWMCLARPAQVAQKQAIAEHAFGRMKNRALAPMTIRGCEDDGRNQRCRARMQLKHDAIGFFSAQSRDLVNVPACPALMQECVHRGILNAVTTGESVEIRLLFNERGQVHLGSPAGVLDWDVAKKSVSGIVGLTAGTVEHGEPGIFVDTPGFGPLFTSSAGFFQAGPIANAHILCEIDRIFSQIPEPGPVLECHAGSGNLTRVIRRFADVCAVESSPFSTRFFQQNMLDNPGSGKVSVLAMPVERSIRSGHLPSTVRTLVLDPPRTGMPAVELWGLLKLCPEHVVLLSCDPMNGSRDASVLLESGYEWTELVLVDSFPNTQHFEIIQVFKKSH